jgi:putative ABC transport system substrate-binding protein
MKRLAEMPFTHSKRRFEKTIHLEVLKEAAGKITRVGVLWDPRQPGTVHEIKEQLPTAARELKLILQPWEVRDSADLEKVFAALNKQRPDALYVPGGALLINNRKRTVDFALKSRLPSIFNAREGVEAGGLLYYGADVEDSYRQIAWYVDKILKGAKPADLPVQQPMKFEFVINLQTANKMVLTIPQWTLMKATKVIK